LIGAVIVTFLPEIMHLDPIDSRIAYGVGLLVVILLLPGGVSAGLLSICRWLGRLNKKREPNGRT
jgi:branched-chain amino acid transport system permease protein